MPRLRPPRKTQSATRTLRQLELDIESVAFGGDGIARSEGKVIFVADSLPGERVRVSLEQEKERFARGRVIERLRAPDYARASPCPYATACGGCQWLSVPYALQLDWKKEFITAALQRIGQIKDIPPFELTPSPEELGYRNRIKIKLQWASDGRIVPSYHAPSSHDLVAVATCAIAAAPVQRALQLLSQLRLDKPSAASAYDLELQHLPASGDAVLASFPDRVPRTLREALQTATRHQEPEIIWAERNEEPRAFEDAAGLQYLTYAGQFQQVNRAANHLVRAWVLQKLKDCGAQKVFDLFCGSGNLSLGLVKEGMQVWGLEMAPKAIQCAAANLEKNQLGEGGLYREGSAATFRAQFPHLEPDVLVVDPPRRGMAEALAPLIALRAPHIIYLSCDPNTLARDLKDLLAAGYHLRELQGFDFFPQTFHVETLAYLSLK